MSDSTTPSAQPLADSPTGGVRASRAALLSVYLTVFLDLVGFGVILPVLPYYAEHFGAGGAWIGGILTAYSAAQFVGAPILGRLSDRVGRRPVMLASLVGSVLSLTLSAYADSLWLLLAARALAGLFGGSISTAQAYVADVTSPKERSKYMGMLGASIGLGFVVGPAIGAGLSRFGFGTAALAAAGLGLANLLLASVRLTESLPPELRRTAAHTRVNFARALEALGRPTLGPALGALFLTTCAFVAMESTFALLAERKFHLTASGLGGIFTFVGVVMVVVQGGLVGRLSKRLGEERLARTGGVILALALAALPFAPSLGWAVAALGFVAAGQGLLNPSLNTLISRGAEAHAQGGTLGLGQAFAAAARGGGPIAAGLLFDRQMSLPYLAAGLLVLLAVAALTQLRVPAEADDQASLHA